MAAGRNTVAIDIITPKQVGALRVAFTKPGGDSTAINIAAKDPNDYITKQEFLDNVTPLPTPPSPTVITAGVTATPLTVAYTGNASTSYALRRSSDNSFDWNTNVQYDGLDFIIIGDDDGTGHFADSYVFGIKP